MLTEKTEHTENVQKSDKIKIKGMSFLAKHGCLVHEKAHAQPFLVDVTLYADLAAAGRADDLTQTVNYAEVYEVVRRVMEGKARDLIEALAEEIASSVLTSFSRVEKIRVTVHKPQAPIPGAFHDVSTTIVRTREIVGT